MYKKILLASIILLFSFSSYLSWYAITSLFNDSNEIMYCKKWDCSLEQWTDIVKKGINDIEKTRKASVYIQDVVIYLLTFITIIAVIYIIYAWFKILISAGNEDDVKKSKTTILSVAIGIAIMWLAFSIVKWIINVLVSA